MRKKVLLLILFLICSTLSAKELKETKQDQPGKTISPLIALSIVMLFNVADLEGLTGGFVCLEPTGVASTEKYYEKDGIDLRLLGMAHVAEASFYQDIKKGLAGKPALMLMEGVTDEKKLLKTPPDYSSIAKKLGVDNQRDKFSPKEMPENVEIVRADLDTSDFATATVEILNLVGQIYSSEGFNWGTLLMMHLKLSDMDISQSFMKDLVSRRNECLIGHLKENMPKHKLILVPWGALHLPEIEKWVVKNGFILKEQKRRIILRFPEYFKYFMSETTSKGSSFIPLKDLSEALGI